MVYQNFDLKTMGHIQISFQKERWASEASALILSAIRSHLRGGSECKIALTGGVSAKKVYLEIANNFNINSLSNIKYYQTDERFVPFNHPDNNSKLILDSLFKNANSETRKKFYRINTNNLSYTDAARGYDDIYPDALDILILTIGDDGHIASIFPDSIMGHSNDKVMTTSSKSENNSHKRISITPFTIFNSKHIFVLAPTNLKKNILFRILESSIQGNYNLPGSLSIKGIWLLST